MSSQAKVVEEKKTHSVEVFTMFQAVADGPEQPEFMGKIKMSN